MCDTMYASNCSVRGAREASRTVYVVCCCVRPEGGTLLCECGVHIIPFPIGFRAFSFCICILDLAYLRDCRATQPYQYYCVVRVHSQLESQFPGALWCLRTSAGSARARAVHIHIAIHISQVFSKIKSTARNQSTVTAGGVRLFPRLLPCLPA